MVPADIRYVLENLEFLRPNNVAIVKIDKGSRDYLLRALNRHVATHR
jgi:hypothetical protein